MAIAPKGSRRRGATGAGGKAKAAKKKAGRLRAGASKGKAAAAGAKVRKPSSAAKRTGKGREKRKTTTGRKRGKSAFAAVKKALYRRREQLLANFGKLTGGASDAASKPVGDRVDDAVFDLEMDSSYTIAEQEARELRLIGTALEKIEAGTYGTCEDCGRPIEGPRLKALPYALLCLKCKEAEEMEEASAGG